MYFPVILHCWLPRIQHDKQLVKTVENLNGLCFRIRVFPINTFYKELFQKCVNCRYHTNKCQHRQGKHKAYKKRKSKILTQPHFDFIKLFRRPLPNLTVLRMINWFAGMKIWRAHVSEFCPLCGFVVFLGWRVVSLTTKTC